MTNEGTTQGVGKLSPENSTSRSPLFSGVLLAGTILLGGFAGTSAACAEDPDDVCIDCISQGLATWACYGAFGYKGSVCESYDATSTQVQWACTSEYTILSYQGAERWPCDGMTGGTAGYSCASWDPGAEVSQVLRTYEVDEDFVADLVADSTPLVQCDGARFEPDPTGAYVLTGASSGTLVYELGLRNGDKPISINDEPITDLEEAAQALWVTYLDGGDSEFTLVVNRNGTNTRFHYELVP